MRVWIVRHILSCLNTKMHNRTKYYLLAHRRGSKIFRSTQIVVKMSFNSFQIFLQQKRVQDSSHPRTVKIEFTLDFTEEDKKQSTKKVTHRAYADNS